MEVRGIGEGVAKSLDRQSAWFAIGLSYFCLFIYGLVDNCRSTIFPDVLKEFQLTDGQGAWFFTVSCSASLLSNLLLLRWMRRIGAYRTLQVFVMVQAVGLSFMAWSPVYAVTLVASAVLGTSLGGLGIALNLLVAQQALPVHRRQLLSGLHCMYGVSSLLAPLCVTIIYGFGLGWHVVLGALVCGPVAVAAISILRRPPGAANLPNSPSSRDQTSAPVKTIFTFGLISGLYVIAELAISTRLTLLARRDWELSIITANRLLAIYFLGLFLGRLLFAVVKSRWRSRTILALSASFGFVCNTLGLMASPFVLSLTGLFISIFYPCLIALINEEWAEAASSITSWCITLQLLGLIIMHFLLGILSDFYGLKWAMWIGPLALAFVVALLLRPGHLLAPSKG